MDDVTLPPGFKEAIEAAKVVDGVAQNRYTRCGGGEKDARATFQCAAHTNCPRYMRVVGSPGNFTYQQKGEHNGELSSKPRKNSVLTFEQERLSQFAMDGGTRPAGLVIGLTKRRIKEIKEGPASGGKQETLETAKDPKGGLKGVLRISHVFHLYLTGFGVVSRILSSHRPTTNVVSHMYLNVCRVRISMYVAFVCCAFCVSHVVSCAVSRNVSYKQGCQS